MTGQVRLVEGTKALSSVRDVVVYFRSDAARSDAAEQLAALDSAQYIMGTRKKAFDPKVLAVPAGATVRFPNRDPILHNVFSVSGDNAFDAGLIPKGDGKTHRFSEPGRVRVFCNVHQEMTANILVLDTPHFVYPDRRGRFTLKDLPDGPGTLLVWHERASASRKVRVGSTEELIVDLPLIKRQVPNHKNKFGRSYKTRQRRGRY
ncbi:MAG: hypothetical protein AB8B96_09205 [Lysobacterales bacterium]